MKKNYEQRSKSLLKKEKGITLTALVITIIILLILAGVSISALVGENGIISNAQRAKIETETAAYEEELKAIEVQSKTEQIEKGLSTAEYLDLVEESINNSTVFEGATTSRKGETTIKILTSEGYIFYVTEDDIIYAGVNGEVEEPDDLDGTNITFTPDETEWTNSDVTVTITVSEGLTGTLQYSLDGSTWSDYTDPIVMTGNGAIYARLYASGISGTYATMNIENIDKLAPNEFTITASDVTISTVTISGSTTDATATSTSGLSGIKCYYYSSDNGGDWTAATAETSYQFTDLDAGTEYNFAMKVEDNAGNTTVAYLTQSTLSVPSLTDDNTTFALDPDNWTKESITVTIETTITGYTLQYSLDGQDYYTYTAAGVEVTSNGKIYARLSNGTDAGAAVSYEITTIDKDAPNVEISATEKGTDYITVKVSSDDGNGSGISSTVISVAKTETPGTDITSSVTVTSNGDGTYTISGLEDNVSYTITATVTDVAGNIGTKSVEESTGEMPDLDKGTAVGDGTYTGGNITFNYSTTAWTKGSVTVTVTLSSELQAYVTAGTYTIEYSTNTTDWYDYPSEGVVFTQNGSLFVRLVDNSGNAGAYATGNVTNIDLTAPTVDIDTSTTTSTATLTVDASDSQSGLATSGTYQYYLDGVEDGEATTSNSHEYTDLKAGTTYTLKVVVKDAVGNTTEKEKDVTLGTVTATIDFSYSENWTNEAVTVTASVSDASISNYTLYTKKDDGNWEATASQEFSSNGTIYAKISDGTNDSDTVSELIENIDTVVPEITTALSGASTNSNSMTLSVGATDSLSGISKIIWYYKLASEADYEYETTNYTDMNGTVAGTTTEVSGIKSVTGLTTGTYNVYVEVYDVAGNKKTSDVIDVSVTITATIEFEYDYSTWTNQNVTATAKVTTSNASNCDIWTSTDDIDYTKTASQTFTANGTIYAKIIDSSGNESTVTSEDITWIDKTAPTITDLKTSDGTTSSIKLTVIAEDNTGGSGLATSGTYQYYLDGVEDGNATTESSHEYTNLTAGKTYTLKVVVKDAVGNENSQTTTATIESLTATITFTGNATTWTNQNVTITASVDSTSASSYTLYTKKDDGNWEETASQEFSSNGTIYAKINDGTNDSGTSSEAVTYIDKTVPEITSVTASTSKIALEATDDSSGIIGYAITSSNTEPDEWKTANGEKTFSTTVDGYTQSKTYYVWVKDNAGNVSESESVTLETVADLGETGAVSFSYTTTEWISGNVTATATLSTALQKLVDDGTYIVQYQQISSGGTLTDDGWETLEKDVSTGTYDVVFSENGSLFVRLYDGTNGGNYATGNVKNIDKTAPTVDSVSSQATAGINGAAATATVTFSASDTISGILYYAVTTSDSTPESGWTTLDEYTLSLDDKTVEGLSDGTTYYVWVKDQAGNVSEGAEIATDDVTAPSITISTGTITSNSIEIIASATDSGSGVDGQTFYINLSDGDNVDEDKSVEASDGKGTVSFTGLVQNTTFTVTVVIEDNDGNKATATGTVQTKLIPSAEEAVDIDVSWSDDGTATVILDTDETDYNIMYGESTASGSVYQSSLTLNNGDTIYIWLTDGSNNGIEYALTVEDYDGPEVAVSLGTGGVTSSTISVSVEADDGDGSGIPTGALYTYSIKEYGADDNTYEDCASIQDTSYTFTKLTAGTTYTIKVTVSDLLGNAGSGTLDQATNQFTYTTGNITFSSITWSDNLASITIQNNTSYGMEYQTNESGGSYDADGTWYTAADTTEVLTKLSLGTAVYARITDGTNVAGYASATITDNVAPTLEVTRSDGDSGEYTNEDITVTITATEKESGLADEPYSFDGGATWQESDESTYTKNTAGIAPRAIDKAKNIGTSSNINITNIDKTGPVVTVTTDVTLNSITVSATAEDALAGMAEDTTFYFYIADTADGLDATNVTVQEVQGTYNSGDGTQSAEYEFTGITSGATMYIRVKVADSLTNSTSVDRPVTTGSISASDISISSATWTGGSASVTITNSSTAGYYVQYKKVSSDESFDDVSWVDSTDTATDVSNLLDGYTVYARLTDGKNYSGTIYQDIDDGTAPTIESVTITNNGTTAEGTDGNTWTAESVTLTVSAYDLESGLAVEAYNFNNGDADSWTSESSKTYTTNTSAIVIQVRDVAGNISEYEKTIEIDNIDSTAPTVDVTENATEGITTKSITVNVDAEDTGVGLESTPTYTYYYKKSTETDYSTGVEDTSSTHTFSSLEADTEYNIMVEVSDRLGNKGVGTNTFTTKALTTPIGNISFSSVVWHQSLATVTVTNNTEYTMKYQITTSTTPDTSDGSSWVSVTDSSTEIDGLNSGEYIYVILTDGVNSTTAYASCTISNTSKTSYSEDELASNTTRSSFEIYGISTSTSEIKVQISAEQSDAVYYNYYYKTINDDEYKLITTNSYYNEAAVITGVSEGTLYQVKATVVNSSGKVTRSTNTATMIAYADVEKGATYSQNRTYIDDSQTLSSYVSDNETTTVTAGYTVSVPAGFKVSDESGEYTLADGVVLSDGTNEYVWIPVNDAIYDGKTTYPTNTSTASSITYKPMTKEQSTSGYYEGMVYTYNGLLSYVNTGSTIGVGKSSYREPSLVTGNSSDGYTWVGTNVSGTAYDGSSSYYNTVLGFDSVTEFGAYLGSSYINMVNGVDSYGGFLVGRYETTYTLDSSENIIVGSVSGGTVLTGYNWYKMYYGQDSSRNTSNPYNTVASVTSTMIYGSQWDAMLNYILAMGDDSSGVYSGVGSHKGSISVAGADDADIMNNIYDLGSNAYEATQEASGASARVRRGGSFDTASTAKPYTFGNISPTESGPGIGTRMSLYLQSTNDTTGPSVTIDEASIEVTTNTATVTVTAVDKESGVSSYYYYISEDGDQWTKAGSSSSNTYTYEGLANKTSYYIKVTAVDGSENETPDTETANQTIITTDELEDVADSAITLTVYGQSGNGVAAFTLADEYLNSGYYIQYIVYDDATSVDTTTSVENLPWVTGDSASGLSNGNVIYLSFYDGVNRPASVKEYTVSGLEDYAYIDSNGVTYTGSEAEGYKDSKGNTYTQAQFEALETSYNTTIKYTDSSADENVAYIPAGFKIGITDTVNLVSDGLVIQDSSGNEYVWIPVETAIETGSGSGEMSRYQSEYSASTQQYFEGILYTVSSGSSSKKSSSAVIGKSSTYREPTLITGGADYTWNISKNSAKGATYDTVDTYYKYMGFGATGNVSAFDSYTDFGQYMNNEYSNMTLSVSKYGGFYIGRYETSTANNTVTYQAVAQSQLSKKPTVNQIWYKLYYYMDSNLNSYNPYYGSDSVTSSMVWGSQWDAMLNWLLSDSSTADFVTTVTGNHSGAIASTGSYSTDVVNNIFDLSSNAIEYTQEGYGTGYRVSRGGYAVTSADNYYSTYNASTRNIYQVVTNYYVPSNTTGTTSYVYWIGSRMALYINDEDDSTDPTIEDLSVLNGEEDAYGVIQVDGTNNVEVEVTAIDNESGISHYIYTIGYYDMEADPTVATISSTTSYSSVYTFEGLATNQTYYIKVEVVDNNGNSADAYTGQVQTATLEVESGTIILEATYGQEGSGVAYFSIDEDTGFEDEGYYIQYKVFTDASSTTAYSDITDWSDGDTVTGLSVGNVIYTRIFDGVNDSGYHMETTITSLETYAYIDENGITYTGSETEGYTDSNGGTYTQAQFEALDTSYNTNISYTDYDTYTDGEGIETTVEVGTLTIPAGFMIGTSSLNKKIEDGLVVVDSDGNQYVWIPVADAIYDGNTTYPTNASTASSITYKPMAKEQSTSGYYEGIVYTYSGVLSYVNTGSTIGLGNSGYREPSLVTGSESNYTWTYTSGSTYDGLYSNYSSYAAGLGISSPTELGQFLNKKFTEMVKSVDKYGGFYVGRYETSRWDSTGTINKNNSGNYVKSVAGAVSMASTNWYTMYMLENSSYSSNPYSSSDSSVYASMIWGSQYDQMLNFILTGSDKSKVTTVLGNHSGTVATTGSYAEDLMSNIFDLGSNVREWTSEAHSTYNRVGRGGSYGTTDTGTASYRYNYYPTSSYTSLGSRLTLYIK